MQTQIKKLVLKHAGSPYGYESSVYINSVTLISVTCLLHGNFTIGYHNHLKGAGCYKCGQKKTHDKQKHTLEKFIELSKIKHGDRYDYSRVVYLDKKTKVEIGCKEHGFFMQQPDNHYVKGTGCPKCGLIKAHIKFIKSTEQYVKDATLIHGNKYDYSVTRYTGNKKMVDIICHIHGSFTQNAGDHILKKYGCPKCSLNGTSKQQQELEEFIKSLGLELITNYRMENGKHIDLYIASKNIGIEYNGLYWHSEANGKDKNYHLNKTLQAKKEGIRLLHIFEDEWVKNQDSIKVKLKHILGMINVTSLYARKLETKIVSWSEAKVFFNNNHFQGGSVPSRYVYGLYNNDGLVACMSFTHDRFSRENGTFELLRYATSQPIAGGAGKLLKYFLKQEGGAQKIISYADTRWSTGDVYSKLGFSLVSTSQPSYFYTNGKGVRYNRQHFQKHKLEKKLKVFDPNKTEAENMRINGYNRIFDCGTTKWELKINSLKNGEISADTPVKVGG